MSEERKVLLSLNDVEVKFNVRGRVLTAIRGVSFDIYENESIAIVGESGSGKSVLTKTFTGMLDSNGFISKGSIIYQDDQLSQQIQELNSYDVYRYKKLVAFLDEQSKFVVGKDIFNQMSKLKADFENSMRLTVEELEVFESARKEKKFERVELFNKKMIAETKEEKRNLAKKIKELDKEINSINVAEKKAKQQRKQSILSDRELVAKHQKTLQELKEAYQEKLKEHKVNRKIQLQNRVFAKEIMLSIKRFPLATQYFYLNSLKDRFSKAYKTGMEMNDLTLEKIYELITFRVLFQSIDNSYFSSSGKIADNQTKTLNKELLARYKKLGNYNRIKRCANSVGGNEMFVNALIKECLAQNKFDRQSLEDILFKVYEECAMTKGTILKGYTILDLTKIRTEAEWQKIRGSRIATIFQDPMTSLNPIVTIGKQITEVIIKHQNCSQAEADKRAVQLMERVGIPDAAKRFKEYPFQYSGGMRQRIVIAIALACQPKVLICDEPTTALDVTIQAQILELIKDLQKEFKFTTVYITHDLGVVASVAERVAVLYAGQIVEAGLVEEIFYDPKHPYTWALLSSLPQLAEKGKELFSIHGTPPSLYNAIKGDAFAERNPYCLAVDLEYEPPYFYVSPTHFAKTWLLDPRAPKIEKPELIQNIHEKLIKAQNQLKKDGVDNVRNEQ